MKFHWVFDRNNVVNRIVQFVERGLQIPGKSPGPTGSGKTTTLYSALNELNNPIYNIVTVEDPVEFQIPGINQVPTKKDIGLTFANALRSILRQIRTSS